jgi:hypothetical protein
METSCKEPFETDRSTTWKGTGYPLRPLWSITSTYIGKHRSELLMEAEIAAPSSSSCSTFDDDVSPSPPIIPRKTL